MVKRKHVESEDESLSTDDELANFIRTSITKRSIKEGNKIVRKSKGKEKMVKGEVGGGSFQSMGLHPSLLRSLSFQGYKLPTPIQRLSIPLLLSNPPRDLVGMARTGSGKTLAYLLPLVHRLAGRHSTTFGARSLIMVPTRELALQILKVGKELARSFHNRPGEHAGDNLDNDDGLRHSQSLRWGLVVGGEGLDDQFEMIANNPDIIIATPGRLLHLIVEMNLDFKSVQYVVFDEADRLFEMGFQVSLSEILKRLPESRQTSLFSATLPKSLVEFAKAGLKDPKLVRLDTESKLNPDLRMAFFSVRQAEKDACLLALIRDVIKVPFASEIQHQQIVDDPKQQAKGKPTADQVLPATQTLIFTATKHHVEYLLDLLTISGYAVSHIYGTLDQSARTHQMDMFRRCQTNILVVTDVAARGIDIPILGNVVNYDFPQGARVFIHRVGRTARAGRMGWAWSFVSRKEVPDLLDLEAFLAKPLVCDLDPEVGENDHPDESAYTESLIFGAFPRERIDEEVECISSLDKVHQSLSSLKQVMNRAQGMYERSKGKASQDGYKRAKELMKDNSLGVHPVLRIHGDCKTGLCVNKDEEEKLGKLLSAVSSFRPNGTVFEVGSKVNSETIKLMNERRKTLQKSVERSLGLKQSVGDDDDDGVIVNKGDVEMADEDEIVAVFGLPEKGQKKSYKDEDFYISYTQKDAQTERGYSLKDGASSFVKQAESVAFDLANDDGKRLRRPNSMRWDTKKKRFIKGDGIGADNMKIVRTENGTKLPASFRSGRFDEWKERSKVDVPKVGEQEGDLVGRDMGKRKFKHHKASEAKPLDKLRGDYERKVRQFRMKDDKDVTAGAEERGRFSRNGKKLGVRRSGKTIGKVKTEIKTVEQIRKVRKVKERRKEKNARPKQAGSGKRSKRIRR